MKARALPVVELAPGSRVIADLHLDPGQRAPWSAFLDFLGRQRGVPALVVLGDLFEYWIGPAQARAGAVAECLAALAERALAGTAVHVVHGNRDFLLGPEFERASGARVHAFGFVGRLASGARLLCVHGDEFATRDKSYQRLRRVLRSRPVRALARALPGGASAALARGLRRGSRKAVAQKSADSVELQAEAAAALATAQGAGFVVCGHAHRYRLEELAGGVSWTVLDAFGGPRDLLEVRRDSLVPGSSRAAGR